MKLNKAFYFALLANFLLFMACDDQTAGPTDTQPASQNAPAATYTMYEFGTVEQAQLESVAGKIHSIVSSKNGVVYVAGQDAANAPVVDSTPDGGLSWGHMNLSNGASPGGVARDFSAADADAKIKITASLHDGVLIYQPASDTTAILFDDDSKAPLAWDSNTDDDSGFAPAKPLAFFEVEKAGGGHVIYAGLDVEDNGLRFFDRSSTDDNWVSGFTEDGSQILRTPYKPLGVGPQGLLLASTDFTVIDQIETANFGSLTNKTLKDGCAEQVEEVELQHVSGTKNGNITSILLVDNKYLLVGFDGSAIPNQGGLFYRDISAGLPLSNQTQWDNTGASDHDINAMILDRNNSKRAVIATNKGLMIFEDGKVSEIVSGERFITQALVAEPANKGNITDKASAKTGFAGSMSEDLVNGLAQDQNGKFFFITPNSVSTLMITSKDL